MEGDYYVFISVFCREFVVIFRGWDGKLWFHVLDKYIYKGRRSLKLVVVSRERSKLHNIKTKLNIIISDKIRWICKYAY